MVYNGWFSRARIFKLLRGPRIDSKGPVPPVSVAKLLDEETKQLDEYEHEF
jgi:hypothetical protein